MTCRLRAILGNAILALVTVASVAGLYVWTRPPLSIAPSDPSEFPSAVHRTVARIQSDLERIAAGYKPQARDDSQSSQPLDVLPAAFALFVAGNVPAMQGELTRMAGAAEQALQRRLSRQRGYATGAAYAKYAAALMALRPETAGHPLTQLVWSMRMAELVLLSDGDMGYPFDVWQHPLLRLPCRLLDGRTEAFREARRRLGSFADPVLSCPSGEHDLELLVQMVRRPGTFPPLVPERPPADPAMAPRPAPPPSPYQIAVARMDSDPDGSAVVLAELARSDMQAKLDYILLLHAFRPADDHRNQTIRRFAQELNEEAVPYVGDFMRKVIGPPIPYDGTDRSLLPTLRLTAVAGTRQSPPDFYTIPCAVLKARPALIAATAALFGSTADNYLPGSGCRDNTSQQLSGFPGDKVRAFMIAARAADGDFVGRHMGTIRYGLARTQSERLTRLELDPQGWLAAEAFPGLEYPYQIWGLLSLGNRDVAARLRLLYEAAHGGLAEYYGLSGLTQTDAAMAARRGLLTVVWGAGCGGAMAVGTISLRQMILAGAPIQDIAAQAILDPTENPAVLRCAETAGLDPLIHVAVDYPEALQVLLRQETDVNRRNEIGKTALMVAAQRDRSDSIALLLAHGAKVNATTDGGELMHNARTALMYAAANASLAAIKQIRYAGGDPFQADTQGRRAIDYLLGYGPVPPNPKLTEAERAEVARLLF